MKGAGKGAISEGFWSELQLKREEDARAPQPTTAERIAALEEEVAALRDQCAVHQRRIDALSRTVTGWVLWFTDPQQHRG